MNEDRFYELLNEYLDGEISRTGFAELKKGIEENPNYRKIFDGYRQMHSAEKAVLTGMVPAKNKKKSPALFTGFFAPGRLLRSAGILANCSILLLTVGLYQSPKFNDVGAANSYFTTSGKTVSPAIPTAQEAHTGAATLEPASGPVVIAHAQPIAAEQVAAGSIDSGSGDILAEDYGFVRF